MLDKSALSIEACRTFDWPENRSKAPGSHTQGTENKRQIADRQTMQRDTQDLRAKKARIHVLERFPVPPVDPQNDQKNARSSPAEKSKSETVSENLLVSKNAPTLLERFARENGLAAQFEETSVTIGRDVHPVSWICFKEAYISDPIHDFFLLDGVGPKVVEQKCEESSLETPLVLMLFENQINQLRDCAGFDLPEFDISRDAGWPDPDRSNWGAILQRTGLRYLEGGHYGMWILFSSSDPASVALALALARIPVGLHAGAGEDDRVSKNFDFPKTKSSR